MEETIHFIIQDKKAVIVGVVKMWKWAHVLVLEQLARPRTCGCRRLLKWIVVVLVEVVHSVALAPSEAAVEKIVSLLE